jgi:SRSO17 transposase
MARTLELVRPCSSSSAKAPGNGRWWIEQGYQQLEDELGLDHCEGRRWQGWHHHVTLTMLAFAFLALERLQAKKNFCVTLAPADDPA